MQNVIKLSFQIVKVEGLMKPLKEFVCLVSLKSKSQNKVDILTLTNNQNSCLLYIKKEDTSIHLQFLDNLKSLVLGTANIPINYLLQNNSQLDLNNEITEWYQIQSNQNFGRINQYQKVQVKISQSNSFQETQSKLASQQFIFNDNNWIKQLQQDGFLEKGERKIRFQTKNLLGKNQQQIMNIDQMLNKLIGYSSNQSQQKLMQQFLHSWYEIKNQHPFTFNSAPQNNYNNQFFQKQEYWNITLRKAHLNFENLMFQIIKNLQSQNEISKKDLESEQIKSDQIISKLKNLSKRIKSDENLNQNLILRQRNTLNQLSELEKKLKNLENQNRGLKNQLALELSQKDQQFKNVLTLQKHNDEYQQKLVLSEKNALSLEQQLQTFKNQLEQQQLRIVQLNQQRNNDKKELHQWQIIKQEFIEKENSLKTFNQQLKSQIMELNNRNGELNNQIQNQSTGYQELEKKYSIEAQQHLVRVQSINEQLNLKIQENQQLENQIKEQLDQINKLMDQINTLNQRIVHLRQYIQEIQFQEINQEDLNLQINNSAQINEVNLIEKLLIKFMNTLGVQIPYEKSPQGVVIMNRTQSIPLLVLDGSLVVQIVDKYVSLADYVNNDMKRIYFQEKTGLLNQLNTGSGKKSPQKRSFLNRKSLRKQQKQLRYYNPEFTI